VVKRFLDGRSYVYRANALEKLTEMTGLLEKWFPGALVTANESDVMAAGAAKKVGQTGSPER